MADDFLSTDDILSRELKAHDKLILADKYLTAQRKAKFISELKMGLGDEIKQNPNGIKIIKKSWPQKLMIFLKKVFSKF